MQIHRSRPARWAGVAGAFFGLAVAALVAQSPARSVKDGVYTTAQATRGRAVYDEKCVTCHASRMWGQDWPEKSVFEVYDVVKNFMPEDAPGSLSAAQTRDVVAYILQNNKLPAGKVGDNPVACGLARRRRTCRGRRMTVIHLHEAVQPTTARIV